MSRPEFELSGDIELKIGPVEIRIKTAETKKKLCPKCESFVDPEAKFCPNCGEKLKGNG